MNLAMSEHEICMMYRDAKDKNEQISILADLNDCEPNKVIDVLSRNGFVPGMPKKKPAEKPRKYERPNTSFRFSDEEIDEIERLYASGMKTGEISERLGLDYKSVSNKICADKLYIQTLEGALKEKDEALKKASTNCEAYKLELDKLMEENELLREQNKYREKFDTEAEALNDAIIMLNLLQVMARQESNSAVFGALFRANELISGVIKELL